MKMGCIRVILIFICGALTVTSFVKHERLLLSKKLLYSSPTTSGIDSVIAGLDYDGDGRISLNELLYSPLVTNHFEGLRKFIFEHQLHTVPAQVKKIIRPSDLLLMSALIVTHKLILRAVYEITHLNRKSRPEYQNSLFGFIEPSVSLAVLYIPFLYMVDISAIVLHALGCTFHLKGNLPRLVTQIAFYLVCGSFVTRVKDWIVNTKIRTWYSKDARVARDLVREETVDELTSLAIWAIFVGICVEELSLEMGFALGSIFALGGVGSASLILALRSRYEWLLSLAQANKYHNSVPTLVLYN